MMGETACKFMWWGFGGAITREWVASNERTFGNGSEAIAEWNKKKNEHKRGATRGNPRESSIKFRFSESGKRRVGNDCI